MSIIPRIIDRNKDKTVQLHMHVQNDDDFAVAGRIVMEIISPEKSVVCRIEKEVRLEERSVINECSLFSL